MNRAQGDGAGARNNAVFPQKAPKNRLVETFDSCWALLRGENENEAKWRVGFPLFSGIWLTRFMEKLVVCPRAARGPDWD